MTDDLKVGESPSSRDVALQEVADSARRGDPVGEYEAYQQRVDLARWALQLKAERDSLRWQLQTFERETANRIETLKEVEQERDEWKQAAVANLRGGEELLTRAEQAEVALAESKKDCDAALRASQAKHQLMVNAEQDAERYLAELTRLRDGLATLPRYIMNPPEGYVVAWADIEKLRADVAARLQEPTA